MYLTLAEATRHGGMPSPDFYMILRISAAFRLKIWDNHGILRVWIATGNMKNSRYVWGIAILFAGCSSRVVMDSVEDDAGAGSTAAGAHGSAQGGGGAGGAAGRSAVLGNGGEPVGGGASGAGGESGHPGALSDFCLPLGSDAGAPSSFPADEVKGCFCGETGSACREDLADFCPAGWPCPVTLDALRHGLACKGAGNGTFTECVVVRKATSFSIDWGQIHMDFDAAGPLSYAQAPAPLTNYIDEGCFESDPNLVKFGEEPAPHNELSETCRSCEVGANGDCDVDARGYVTLPPYPCLAPAGDAGAPGFPEGAPGDCTCSNQNAQCTGSLDSFTFRGLDAPVTLEKVRGALACANAGDLYYRVCTRITVVSWADQELVFDRYTGKLREVSGPALLSNTEAGASCSAGQPGRVSVTDGDLVPTDTDGVPYDTGCRECRLGAKQTCLVDDIGRVALPDATGEGGLDENGWSN